MKVHISLNVKDVDKSVEFYKKMLGLEPVKLINAESVAHTVEQKETAHGLATTKTGYAKFDVANPPLNLVLNEVKYDTGGSLSHLGLQVESTEDVLEFRQKWKSAGLLTVDEMDVNCCYANQDKTWVQDPDGNEWEAFVVLKNLENISEIEQCECSNKISEYVEAKMDSCCDSTVKEIGADTQAQRSCC